MIEFLDLQSAFEHYKRVLGRNGPVETRAKYHCDRLHVEHYNAHTGQFIIGAVFTKGTRRKPGSFLGLLSGASGNDNWPQRQKGYGRARATTLESPAEDC
jgi:hypothetical protein